MWILGRRIRDEMRIWGGDKKNIRPVEGSDVWVVDVMS